jgi:hypothetical protein
MLAIFVPAATSLTMVIRTLNSPATLTKLFGYFALIMVLLPMLIDYFKDYTLHVALALYRYKFMVWYLYWDIFRKVQDYVMEDERV